jgi:hypothetical protein
MDSAILNARASRLEEINGVIARAKRGLGYDASYVEAALALMHVDERYLAENRRFEAYVLQRLVGFASVEPLESGVVLLDHLWIEPGYQRCGIGRRPNGLSA